MTPTTLHVLAFEPYDAGSHRAVRESITRLSRHEWRWLTRGGRSWKWRMRLAALELADAARATIDPEAPVDVILATSLLNVGDLVAALPRHCRRVPVALYMHENQVAYPVQPGLDSAERDVHFALTNLASALVADLVIWNSAWNRRSFLEGIDDVLRHATDTTLRDAARRIDERSVVIWPPVESAARGVVLHNLSRDGEGPVRVVWPHRWEHDKGPEELLSLVQAHSEAANLRWTILGQRFTEEPRALVELRRRFADRLDHVGYIESRAAYEQVLQRCDWVLSTARHEYFGVAVVEALLAGCLPWLPARLSYPELLPRVAQGLSPMAPPADTEAVRAAIGTHLAPARAPEAVRRLDDALADLVATAAVTRTAPAARRGGAAESPPSTGGPARRRARNGA